MKIKDGNGSEISQAAVLRKYFGLPNQTVSEFMGELKGLTVADKEELSAGAAKMLGYTVEL